MKKIIFGKYKLINLLLFVSTAIAFTIMSTTYDRWFKNADIYYIYDVFDGIYHPATVASKWLAGILAALLFFPARIFRKWLFYVAPPILLLTYFLVQGISVYSSNLLNPTRAKMAENGMMFLALVTVIFVSSHLIYEWRKKKVSKI